MANASGLVIGGNCVPFVAEEALDRGDAIKQGTVGTDAQYVKKATAGTVVIGFVDQDYDAEDHVSVQVDGVAYGRVADTSINAASLPVKATADGEIVLADTDQDEVAGIALAAGGAENDLIPILIGRFTLSA
jgi:hypothetical protein